jgi:hypothetical protein
MFLAFLSLTVVGVALLIAVIVFYSKKDVQVSADYIRPNQIVQDHAPNHPIPVQEADTVNRDEVKQQSTSDVPERKNRDDAEYIPILRIREEIPGIKGRELVHYAGTGTLYSLESTDDLKNIEIKSEDLDQVLEGKLYLTSRYIIIHSEDTVKKFTIASIEGFRFSRTHLMVKRKRVKTKKDVFKIDRDLKNFKYILHALT